MSDLEAMAGIGRKSSFSSTRGSRSMLPLSENVEEDSYEQATVPMAKISRVKSSILPESSGLDMGPELGLGAGRMGRRRSSLPTVLEGEQNGDSSTAAQEPTDELPRHMLQGGERPRSRSLERRMSTQRAHPEAYGIGSGVPMLAGETRHIGREGNLPMHPVGGSPRLPVGVPVAGGFRRVHTPLPPSLISKLGGSSRAGWFTQRTARLPFERSGMPPNGERWMGAGGEWGTGSVTSRGHSPHPGFRSHQVPVGGEHSFGSPMHSGAAEGYREVPRRRDSQSGYEMDNLMPGPALGSSRIPVVGAPEKGGPHAYPWENKMGGTAEPLGISPPQDFDVGYMRRDATSKDGIGNANMSIPQHSALHEGAGRASGEEGDFDGFAPTYGRRSGRPSM